MQLHVFSSTPAHLRDAVYGIVIIYFNHVTFFAITVVFYNLFMYTVRAYTYTRLQ